MTATSTPFGLKPVQKLGGRPENQSERLFPIASAYATSIFFGDPVIFSAGNITKCVYNFTAGGTIGMFAGCKYTNPTTKQPQWAMYWPASTVATDAMAYVYDDPFQIFLAQANGAVAANKLNLNISWANTLSGAGSTVTGLSAGLLDASSAATTNSLQYRIVGFDETPSNAAGDAFTVVKIMANFGFHNYLAATGV